MRCLDNSLHFSRPTGRPQPNTNTWSSENTLTLRSRGHIQGRHPTIQAVLQAADKDTVAYFAVYLSRSVTPTTIKVYMSAISAWHNRKGFNSDKAEC